MKALSKTKHLIYGAQHATNISINFTNFQSKLNSCVNSMEARQVFDELAQKSSTHYNLMLRYYTQKQQPNQVLQLFEKMLTSGEHCPDGFTYPLVFKACGDLSVCKTGKTVHCRVLFSGYESNTYVCNSLMAMYMNCGQVEASRRLFDSILSKTVVSWNTMIGGYLSNGLAEDALKVFDKMIVDGIIVDQATVVSMLPACASLRDLQRGRMVHELVQQKGLVDSIAVTNALIDMYAKCGCICEARSIFDQMIEKDVVSWTAIMGGYVLNDDPRSALELCLPMQLEGIWPNSVTVAVLLSACISSSDLSRGKCIHGWAAKRRLVSDVIVETSLIDMYAKCNRVDLSIHMLSKSSRKRTVPCNAIISGYVHNGLGERAIEVFKQMLVEMVDPDGTTFISLLPAYANLADLKMAKNIHGYLVSAGFFLKPEISTNLIDIYSKCGNLESANEVFNGMANEDKDIITWTTIIAGYGMHGHGETAILKFDKMVQAGIKPNDVTFTAVLHACSHAGLVDEGVRMFKSMVVDHHTAPLTNHYTCIIDLVGRAGRLKEAYELIKVMHLKPNNAVWGALLGACVIHQDVELGEVAAKHLFDIEPHNTGNYILMTKLYAAVGRWEDAENVRIMINEKGLRKTPGCSLV